MAKRKQLGRKFSGNDIFSAKIICGGFFGAKVWHSNSKYRRVIWQCNQKFSQNCTTPHLYEDEIKMRFLTAFASFFQQRDLVLETCQMLIDDLSDTTLLDLRIEKVSREMNAVAAVTKNISHKMPKQSKIRRSTTKSIIHWCSNMTSCSSSSSSCSKREQHVSTGWIRYITSWKPSLLFRKCWTALMRSCGEQR